MAMLREPTGPYVGICDIDPLGPNMQRMADKLVKGQRDMFSVEMTPLAILYLMSIHLGDFDKRIHMGHFSTHDKFKQRVQDLIRMDMIGYDGQHFIKPRGLDHVNAMLALIP